MGSSHDTIRKTFPASDPDSPELKKVRYINFVNF